MTQLIDGKAISAQIKEEVKEKVAALKEQGREVTLAVSHGNRTVLPQQ